MAPLRILITNHALAELTGSELYVRYLATALLHRGHAPIAFSPRLGEVARDLRSATVPVVDDLAAVAAPLDLIHGQHHLETMSALLHFPGVPAIFVCHGWLPPAEAPPKHPRIRRYVAVDHACRDRLLLENGIPEERLRVLLNFVDLERFKPRAPLPERPRRALVFSNYAAEQTCLAAARAACAKAGIAVDAVGQRSGQVAARPEDLLGRYDLVFAKGRSALEALTVGCAVVLCDEAGAGPLVTVGGLDRLRSLNFGLRALAEPVTPEVLAREIARYDAADAAEVSRRIRSLAGRDLAVEALVDLYKEVIAEQARLGLSDPQAEGSAASAYLLRAQRDFEDRLRIARARRSPLRRAWDRLRGTRAFSGT